MLISSQLEKIKAYSPLVQDVIRKQYTSSIRSVLYSGRIPALRKNNPLLIFTHGINIYEAISYTYIKSKAGIEIKD